jgi:hypothetical protein
LITMKPQHIQWLQRAIWVLVYGGLLTLVLGLSVQRSDAVLGWSLFVGGISAAVLGVALIFVRSKIKEIP